MLLQLCLMYCPLCLVFSTPDKDLDAFTALLARRVTLMRWTASAHPSHLNLMNLKVIGIPFCHLLILRPVSNVLDSAQLLCFFLLCYCYFYNYCFHSYFYNTPFFNLKSA